MKQTTSLRSIRRILAYPQPKDEDINRRIKEIHELGVYDIVPAGETFIGDFRILGKGCTSVVVLTKSKYGKAALKIRRMDSNRESCAAEARILRSANMIGVGPKLFCSTDDFLLMEFIDGVKIKSWILEKTSEGKRETVMRALRQILQDCHRLDIAGIDHGDLNPAKKHIIVRSRGDPTILDFESASTTRRTTNVTSISQYLFIGSEIAERLQTELGFDREAVIDSLREYKRDISRERLRDLLTDCRIDT